MTDPATQFCPECGKGFDEAELGADCPSDGVELRRPDASRSLVGALIDGRFRVVDKLGEGAAGIVYRGVQLSIARPVAIKVLRRRVRSEEEVLGRFVREARLASSFNHPNIVRPIEFGRDEDHDIDFFAMDYVEGVDLRDLLDHGRLDLQLALEIVHQVASALSEAHDHDIVHRDLKPSNLTLQPVSDGRLVVKVLDFGVARALDQESRLTKTGTAVGTPYYMSPEQVEDDELEGRTDLYAVGVLLYEMLAGAPPFTGGGTEVLLQHLRDEPPSLSEQCGPRYEPPADLHELVHDLISKSPEDRPDDARELQARVEAIWNRHGLERVRISADDGLAAFEPWVASDEPTADGQGGSSLETTDPLPAANDTGDVPDDQIERPGEPSTSVADELDPDAESPSTSETLEADGEALAVLSADGPGATATRQQGAVGSDHAAADGVAGDWRLGAAVGGVAAVFALAAAFYLTTGSAPDSELPPDDSSPTNASTASPSTAPGASPNRRDTAPDPMRDAGPRSDTSTDASRAPEVDSDATSETSPRPSGSGVDTPRAATDEAPDPAPDESDDPTPTPPPTSETADEAPSSGTAESTPSSEAPVDSARRDRADPTPTEDAPPDDRTDEASDDRPTADAPEPSDDSSDESGSPPGTTDGSPSEQTQPNETSGSPDYDPDELLDDPS